MIRRITRDGRGRKIPPPCEEPGARNKRPRRKRTSHNYFGDPPGKAFDQDGNELEIRYSKGGSRMRCTAWLPTRQGSQGRRARFHAQQCGMWSEPERDKCRLHGGRMLEALEERGMVVKGTRSKYAVPLATRARELHQDPELNTLRNELAFLKAAFEGGLVKIDAGDPDAPKPGEFIAIIEATRRTLETQVKVETERKARLDVSELVVVVNQIKLIIEEEIEDLNARKRIAARLRRLVLRPARGRSREGRHAAERMG